MASLLVSSVKHAAQAKDSAAWAAAHTAYQSPQQRATLKSSELVSYAELCIKAGNFFQAQESLEIYYTRRRWYSKGAAMDTKDSWYIRACLAHADIVVHQNRQLKGKQLSDGVQLAAQLISQGIQAAQQTKRYTHMVYNGSVKMWHAIRPFMRRGRWKLIHEPLTTVADAVKQLEGHLLWKAALASAMAQCAADMGNTDEANKNADTALELAAQANEGENAEELIRTVWALKVNVADTGPKSKPVEPKDASPAALADLTVQRILSKQLAGPAATAAVDAAYRKLDPNPDAPPDDVPLLTVARLAWASALLGDAEPATALAKRVLMGKHSRSRAWAGLTLAHISLQAALPATSHGGATRMTRADVAQLCTVLEELEQCSQEFLGVGDVHGLHACCKDVWNAGLPMLQHDTRHHVKRAFNAAASALAAVSSPLTDLRTRLHLEVAKCGLAADAPAAALEEASRADVLDYVGSPTACERYRLERPWDRHLQPLLAALRSRAQDRPAGVATDPAASAIELIQRARETRAPRVRQDRLHKAIAALQQIPLVQPVQVVADGEAAGGGGEADGGAGEAEEERAERYCVARELTALWGEVVQVAWAMHLYDVVLQAAPYVLWADWAPELDEEMAMLQGQCMYFEAEAAVLALKHRNAAVAPSFVVPDASTAAADNAATGTEPDSTGAVDDGTTAANGANEEAAPEDAAEDAQEPGSGEECVEGQKIRAPAQTVEELQRTVAEGLVHGMQRAIDCQKPWAVINGAVYCWNAYLDSMQNGWYSTIAGLLLKVARLLMSLEAGEQQQELLRNVVVAASRGARHQYLLDMLRQKYSEGGSGGVLWSIPLVVAIGLQLQSLYKAPALPQCHIVRVHHLPR